MYTPRNKTDIESSIANGNNIMYVSEGNTDVLLITIIEKEYSGVKWIYTTNETYYDPLTGRYSILNIEKKDCYNEFLLNTDIISFSNCFQTQTMQTNPTYLILLTDDQLLSSLDPVFD